ncbi:MAG: hypothetical protein Q9208_001331 [Pyrenodesmia sp. 3 TL-2023]
MPDQMSASTETFRRDEPCGIENCRSKRFYEEGGLFYCKRGHLQHSNPQTQEDDDDFGTQGRKTKQKKEAEEKVSKIYRGPQALELFLQAFQLILWKQCYTLINNMSLPQEFEDVVKGLWALRLDKIDLGTEEVILHSSQETSKLEADSQGNHGKERLSRTKPVPSLIDSLATCYLGMVILRLPISLSDLHQ